MIQEFITINDHRKEVINQHNNIHTVTLEYPNIAEENDDKWDVSGFLSVYEGDSFIEKLDIHLSHDLTSSFEEECFSLREDKNVNVLISHILFLLWNNYKLCPMEDLDVRLFTDSVKTITYNQ